jgi:hypothetical protein
MALIQEGGHAGGRADERALSLSLSPSRTVVTPTASAPTLAQDNTSRGFSPFVFHIAPTHLGWDTQRQFYSSVQGPTGVETPTVIVQQLHENDIHMGYMTIDAYVIFYHKCLHNPFFSLACFSRGPTREEDGGVACVLLGAIVLTHYRGERE